MVLFQNPIPTKWLIAWLAASAMTACTGQTTQQQPRNGPGPTLAEKQDCWAEARRRAELQYPRDTSIPYGSQATVQWWTSDGRSEAETRNFQQCLRSKGYRSPGGANE